MRTPTPTPARTARRLRARALGAMVARRRFKGATPRPFVRFLAIISLAIALLPGVPRVLASETPSEYEFKAAFLYNFVQFVEWRAGAFESESSPLIIATLGPDPFRGALDQILSGKMAAGHPLLVRHYPRGSDVESCHLLFVGPAAGAEFAPALEKLHGASVLVITDTEKWENGGIIHFFTENGKIRFEISPPAAARAGLRINAKLLRLAKIHQE